MSKLFGKTALIAGTSRDVGTAVAALASNDARFVTDDTLRVSGGSYPDHQ